MNFLDYSIILAYLVLVMAGGVIFTSRASENLEHYFLSGRKLPWWLAGISMVTTTFAADTPLAVTGLVASHGIAGNWLWWNFAFSGLMTVFFFAHLWRRAGVMTDAEFAEIRYGGRPAAFLRVFRALYLAIPVNVIIMGWVTVAMAKIIQVTLGWPQWQTVAFLYGFTGVYLLLAGLWGVVITDFIQFFLAMAGCIVLAIFALDHVGGIAGLQQALARQYGPDHHLLSFSPFQPELALSTVLVWLGMQWWASWYPGAEPGGGGYIAQRMFSAKDERHAVLATLLFNVAHYALRPWPWIIVALVSLAVFPGLPDPEQGYPMAMKAFLPHGFYGLMIVAFFAAFMSTISTHLNWGASYLVSDVWLRFDPQASQKKLLQVSRLSTAFLIFAAIAVSYFFDSVKSSWEFLLALGAGTGPVYLLRWYWWRINAYSEISALLAAFAGTVALKLAGVEDFSRLMLLTTAFTSLVWLTVTFLTPAEKPELLQAFARRVRPGGPGWKNFTAGQEKDPLLQRLFFWLAAVALVYAFLFGLGYLFLAQYQQALLAFALATLLVIYLSKYAAAAVFFKKKVDKSTNII